MRRFLKAAQKKCEFLQKKKKVEEAESKIDELDLEGETQGDAVKLALTEALNEIKFDAAPA